ncbi:GPO family capsid scaffolding protein, partial [Plesiomonas shigelloides]
MPRLMTGWLCVGVSGKTVDGRNIDPQWLVYASETYDRQTYTALIWPRHHENNEVRCWSFNYGEIDALKYGRDGDKVKLYARLMPN